MRALGLLGHRQQMGPLDILNPQKQLQSYYFCYTLVIKARRNSDRQQGLPPPKHRDCLEGIAPSGCGRATWSGFFSSHKLIPFVAITIFSEVTPPEGRMGAGPEQR